MKAKAPGENRIFLLTVGHFLGKGTAPAKHEEQDALLAFFRACETPVARLPGQHRILTEALKHSDRLADFIRNYVSINPELLDEEALREAVWLHAQGRRAPLGFVNEFFSLKEPEDRKTKVKIEGFLTKLTPLYGIGLLTGVAEYYSTEKKDTETALKMWAWSALILERREPSAERTAALSELSQKMRALRPGLRAPEMLLPPATAVAYRRTASGNIGSPGPNEAASEDGKDRKKRSVFSEVDMVGVRPPPARIRSDFFGTRATASVVNAIESLGADAAGGAAFDPKLGIPGFALPPSPSLPETETTQPDLSISAIDALVSGFREDDGDGSSLAAGLAQPAAAPSAAYVENIDPSPAPTLLPGVNFAISDSAITLVDRIVPSPEMAEANPIVAGLTLDPNTRPPNLSVVVRADAMPNATPLAPAADEVVPLVSHETPQPREAIAAKQILEAVAAAEVLEEATAELADFVDPDLSAAEPTSREGGAASSAQPETTAAPVEPSAIASIGLSTSTASTADTMIHSFSDLYDLSEEALSAKNYDLAANYFIQGFGLHMISLSSGTAKPEEIKKKAVRFLVHIQNKCSSDIRLQALEMFSGFYLSIQDSEMATSTDNEIGRIHLRERRYHEGLAALKKIPLDLTQKPEKKLRIRLDIAAARFLTGDFKGATQDYNGLALELGQGNPLADIPTPQSFRIILEKMKAAQAGGELPPFQEIEALCKAKEVKDASLSGTPEEL